MRFLVPQQDKFPNKDRHFRAYRARVGDTRSTGYCNIGASAPDSLIAGLVVDFHQAENGTVQDNQQEQDQNEPVHSSEDPGSE